MSENLRGTRLSPPPEQQLGWSKERQVVQAEAHSRLRNSGYHELRLISCAFQEGVLTLRGQVPSFYLKQVAQELIRRLDGAEEINNHLEVVAPTCPSSIGSVGHLAHEVLRAIEGVEHIVNELEVQLEIRSHGGEAEMTADAKRGFDWADTALLTCQMGRRIGMVIETAKAPA